MADNRKRARLGSRTPTAAVLELAELAVSLVALGLVEVALVYSSEPYPPWVVVLFPVVAGVYLAAGVVAWLRRPSNHMGALMTAGALAWLAAGMANVPIEALEAVGLIVATVPIAIVVHLLHGFPSGRLRGALSLVTVVATYVVALVLQAPSYLFGENPDSSTSDLHVADRPGLASAGIWLQRGAGATVLVMTAVILAGRFKRTPRPQRRVVGPLYLYGVAAAFWVPFSGDVPAVFPGDRLWLAVTQLAVLAGVPVAFAVVVLRGGFARTGEIEELGAWLGRFGGERPELRDALAQMLGDPSLELAFWLEPPPGYMDAKGRAIVLPGPGSARAAVEVSLAGRRVGAIVYDSDLIAEPELVRTAGRVVALALDRERLTVELRASRDRLRRSSARVVAAADTERRRIARDLHDGLQTRLVLLAVTAGDALDDAVSASGRMARAATLRDGIEAAIGELRAVVQGVLPATLAERGLYAAAEELAERMPIPIELALDRVRAPLPAPVESTGYFVVSEALTNAIKHSRAHGLRLSIEQENGSLRIEIADDGVGGASTVRGAGLEGMAARVDALDGLLTVDSPPGGGTRILAEVPCES